MRPLPEALAIMPWQDILKALETGSHESHGAQLSAADQHRRGALSGQSRTGSAARDDRVLRGGREAQSTAARPGMDGAWTSRIPGFSRRRRRVSRRSRFHGCKLKWAFGFPNTVTAYSQPTVVGGRVYTGSNDGTVYALDAQSGCIYWMYQAKAMVRDAVVIGPGPRAYFGDLESNFYALDADTGKLVWQKKLDDQPFTRITGTAKLHDGRLYVPIASQEENAGANPQYSCCTFRGNLVAVKASDGS